MKNNTILILLGVSLVTSICFIFILPYFSYIPKEETREIVVKINNNKKIKENSIDKYNSGDTTDYLLMARDKLVCIYNKQCDINNIDTSITKFWSFLQTNGRNLNGENELYLVAISTTEALGGEYGKKVCYNTDINKFIGYGTNIKCELQLFEDLKE